MKHMIKISMLVVLGAATASADTRIRVACIGDSITYGYVMTNRLEECYPAQLQKLLGDRYEVRNFGDPGAGVYLHLRRGDDPRAWRLRGEYEPALAFRPDIVVCNLGINDASEYPNEYLRGADGKTPLEKGTFRRQYADMLKSFAQDGRRPRFLIWTRLGPTGKKHGLKGRPNAFVMEQDLEAVARDVGAEALDMYTPLAPLVETEHFHQDGIHPEGGAQKIIAEVTAAKILGRDGEKPPCAVSVCAAADTAVGRALKPYIESGEIPGYVSVLIDGEREEWTMDGWADVGKRVPYRSDTLIRICSQTKGMIGLAAARLVLEGKLSLEDPIAKFFPEYNHLEVMTENKGGVKRVAVTGYRIKLRDCLSHTAGFDFETPVSKALGWTSTPPRVAAAIAATYPLIHLPGTKFKYSNTGIDVAVAVIEKVTGEGIEAHLKRTLFDPLGMKDTTFKPNAEQQSRLATVYSVTSGQVCRAISYRPLPEPYDSADRFPSGGAGLFSTPHDLVEFYRMIANEGRARDGRQVVPVAAIRDILAVKQTPPSVNTAYSLGMFVENGTIAHDGALKTTGIADPRRRQVRVWIMQCDYLTKNRWHQYNVWSPVADRFFGAEKKPGLTDFGGVTP